MSKNKFLKLSLASALCLTMGLATVACTTPDGGDEPPPAPPSHEITVVAPSLNVEVGQSITVALDVETMDGEVFTYSVDNSGVVYIDASSWTIYGLKAGTVNITFSVKNNPSVSKTITVTVAPISTQYAVTIGDNAPIMITHGQKIPVPTDIPTKESTASTDYAFDCWVKAGTNIAWNFDTDVVTSAVTLEAKFTETTRKYSATVNGVTAEYEYGSKIPAPSTTPTKEETATKTYTFSHWENETTGEKWNFNVDKVMGGGINIVPVFTEADRTFALVLNVESTDITFNGTTYKTHEFTAKEIADMNITISDGATTAPFVNGAELVTGTYTLSATYNGNTYTSEVAVGAECENETTLTFTTSLLNGSVGGYSSFAHASKQVKGADEVWLGYYDYTYQDAVQGSEYYIEADINHDMFEGKSNANLVGIMAAVVNGDLSGQGVGKLIIGVAQNGELGYTVAGSWGSKYVAIKDVKDKVTFNDNKYNYKLGVYRNGAAFAIFLNGEYIETISFGMFENCGFGVGSMADNQQNGYTKFTNFKYSFNSELLSAIKESISKENEVIVKGVFETDYVTDAYGQKVFLQEINYEIAKRVVLEIYDKDDNLVKTITTAGKNFTVSLPTGRHTVKAIFNGTKANTVRETEINITKSSKAFVFDLSVTDIGGSYTLPSGTVVNSFGQFYSFPSANSITVTNNTYAYINGVTGSTYYIEATVTRGQKGWYGFILNSSDGAPTNGYKKVAVALYESGNGQPSLYVQRSIAHSWGEGVGLGSVASYTGSASTYKIAALRIDDNYYLYINGSLAWSERITSLDINGNALPKNNVSGFGIFRGSNFAPEADTLSNIKYTTSLEAINAIRRGEKAVLNCGEGVKVISGNREVTNGGTIYGFESETKQLVIDVPAGKVLSNLVVKIDGVEQEISYSASGAFNFELTRSGTLTVDVEFEEAQEAVLNFAYESAFVEKDGKKLALYDISDVNPADIKVEVINIYGGKTDTFVFDGNSKTLTVTTGKFMINYIYKDNIWSKVLDITEPETDIVGQLSEANLGGSITFTANTGATTTINSFQNVEAGATKGNGWELVDGHRNTVKTSSYTFTFQHQVVGNKYYLEGVFDSTVMAGYGAHDQNFSGLLFVHANDTALDGNTHNKSVAYIKGDAVVFGTSLNWGMAPIHIANYKDVLGEGNYDPTAVKLGVLRDGKGYYFFVNDVFVAYRVIETYGTNVSGFGVGSSVVTNIISNFNYSTNEKFLSDMVSGIQVQGRSIDIYLIAGQSNAAGYSSYNAGTAFDMDEHLVYGYQNIMYAGDAEASGNNYTTTIHNEHPWSLARVGQGAGTAKIGPELGMAQALSAYYNKESGKEAGIIKFAHGGTCLLDSIGGENACEGNWVPPSYEATIRPQSPGNLTGGLYRNFLKQVTKNVNELKAMGYTEINIKGLYWMQGCSDRGNPNAWKTAVGYLASDMRAALTNIMGYDLSNMPFIVGEISDTVGINAGSNQTTYNNTVNTNVAFNNMINTLPSTYNEFYVTDNGKYKINDFVGSASKAVGTDTWHWNMKDCISIGNDVGNLIINQILK